jgi:hypothetical protein
MAPIAFQAPLASALQGRSHIEALLRERKLDRTLTTALPAAGGEDRVAPFGLAALDARLLGGLPRGHLSEVVGAPSTGRTSLAWTWLGAATQRGEAVALIDTFDRFDPASGVACGIALPHLLWVRGQALSKTSGAVDPTWLPGTRAVEGPGTMLERTIDRALKALNLVLQSGVCTAVVLDLADVPVVGLRRIPMTTWLRVQRVIEGSETACLLMAPLPLARSAAGCTITTSDGEIRWAGEHDRARRLAGLSFSTRLSSPRRTVSGVVAVETTTAMTPASFQVSVAGSQVNTGNHYPIAR